MSILLIAIFGLAFSVLILSFIDLKLSIALYVSYLILVPYLQFNIGGFPLSYNLVNTLVLSVFLYHSYLNNRYKVEYQFIIPFLLFYFSLLFLSLFSKGMPWGIQFTNWRVSFMQTCFTSFIVWNLTLAEPKFIKYFKWSLIISIFIAGVYGIFLMKLEGKNPYISMVTEYFGKEDYASRYAELDSRLDFSTASKIQSTMIHPMTWTLLLCFAAVFLSALYWKEKSNIPLYMLGLVGFNILISGVRTGIAAIAIGFIYYLIRFRNFKLIFLTIAALVAMTFLVQSNESLSNLFASFTDFSGKESNISGSSITMRIEQFQGSLDEIKGTELTGKGFGWTSYYISNFGRHPVILVFESLVFMVLCNSGYIGALIWTLFILSLFILNRKILNQRTDIIYADTMIIVYTAYAIGTGEYGYMPFFAIFYAFLLGYLHVNSMKTIPQDVQKTQKTNRNYIQFDIPFKSKF